MKYGDNLVLASHSKNSTDFTSHETPNEIERNDKNESDWKASRQAQRINRCHCPFSVNDFIPFSSCNHQCLHYS